MSGGGGAEAGGLRPPGRAVSGAGLPHRLVRRARPGRSPRLLPGSVPSPARVGRLLRRAVEVLDVVLSHPGQLLSRPEAPRARLAAIAGLARPASPRGRTARSG